MTSNKLSVDDCRAIAASLAVPLCRLATLNMKWAGVGPESAQALASALGTNASVTRLNVERNGLGWKGGRAFGEALATNSTLTAFIRGIGQQYQNR